MFYNTRHFLIKTLAVGVFLKLLVDLIAGFAANASATFTVAATTKLGNLP